MRTPYTPNIRDQTFDKQDPIQPLNVEGTRILRGRDRSYNNREGQETDSHFRFSEEGQRMIKDNPGMLKALTLGIGFFEQNPHTIDGYNRLSVKLSDGENYILDAHSDLLGGTETTNIENKGKVREVGGIELELERLNNKQGAQSQIYIMTINGKKYAVKRPVLGDPFSKLRSNPFYSPESNPFQPYTNELAQITELQNSKEEELDKLGVRFPTIYFATNSILVSEYIEGSHPKSEDISGIAEQLGDIIRSQASESTNKELWSNVHPDTDAKFLSPINSNFIRAREGYLYCVDPLLYSKEN